MGKEESNMENKTDGVNNTENVKKTGTTKTTGTTKSTGTGKTTGTSKSTGTTQSSGAPKNINEVKKSDGKLLTFLKKPTLYIVLTVIFSLLLVADIVLAIFGPRQTTNSFMNMDSSAMTDIMSGMDDSSDSADADTDLDSADTSDASDFSGGMDMQGGMGAQGGMDFSGDMDSDSARSFGDDSDSSGMPSFDTDSDASGFPSMGDFSTDADADIDISDFTDANTNTSRNTSFLQTLRSHWVVILIILAILDIASIVMLIITSKWERKRMEEELRAQMHADGEVHLIRPVTKKRKGSGWAWLIPIVGMVLLAVLVENMSSTTSQTSSETEATVYSMTVETGTIDTVLPGTGTLTEEDSSDVTLPDGVEINEWYYADGDTVTEGDVLAKLDTASIMSVIASVQTSMDEIDEKLAEHEDDAIDEEMLSTVDGRVIKIYAAENESVVDTMYESSALMLISIDGLMAVSIETDADLGVGDSLDVTMEDDTVVTGKVESYINGTAVITISDEYLGVDEEVTISDEDGNELGTGTLVIHSEVKVTGYTGTVSEISVAEGDEVEVDDILLVLTDVDYTAEYDMLLAERTELEETMQELFSLYADPYLYATCSGVISGLDDTTVTASSSTETGYLGMNTVTVTYILSVSNNDEDDTEAADDTETEDTEDADTCVSYIGVVTSVQSAYINMLLLPESYMIEKYGDLSDIDLDTENMTEEAILDASVYAPVFAVTDDGWTVGSLTSVEEGDMLVIGYYIADDDATLEWIVNISEEAAEESASENGSEVGTAELIGTSSNDVEAAEESGQSRDESQSAGETDETGSDFSGDGFSMTDETSEDSGSSMQDMSGMSTDSSDFSNSFSQDASTDTSSLSSDFSFDTSTDESMDASALTDSDDTAAEEAAIAALQEEITSTYGVDETTWLSVTPQDSFTISITVDELDILSVEVGQEVTVTLDAFPGQSFAGEVTDIDLSGTNSGGNSKFTATVTIDRGEDMLVGMNASVKITLDTTDEVLVIPEDALVEDGDSVYVYTTYDEETGTLGGLTEVTTGTSDGENVEILSGLSEGDAYYYSILDVVNYSYSSAGTSSSISFSFDSILGGSSGGGDDFGGMGRGQ